MKPDAFYVIVPFAKFGLVWIEGQEIPEGTFEPDVHAELESNGFIGRKAPEKKPEAKGKKK